MIRLDDRSSWRVLLFALVVALVVAPLASGGGKRRTGSLALNAVLSVGGLPAITCPPDAPPEADICAQRGGGGRVRGLGSVKESYFFFVDQDPSPACGGVRLLHSTGEFAVAGRGTIKLDLGRSDQCFVDILKANQPFSITGGSGAYTGATGAGTVNHALQLQGAEPAGTDTWSGSLGVPGLEFDLTPPTLSGLINKTVRARKGAKRALVRYRVTARDLVDGSVSASCQPSSGTRFRVGRTVVKCYATDTSENRTTGSFTVVVKRRR